MVCTQLERPWHILICCLQQQVITKNNKFRWSSSFTQEAEEEEEDTTLNVGQIYKKCHNWLEEYDTVNKKEWTTLNNYIKEKPRKCYDTCMYIFMPSWWVQTITLSGFMTNCSHQKLYYDFSTKEKSRKRVCIYVTILNQWSIV